MATGAHVALHSRWEVRSRLAGGKLYLSARKYIVMQFYAIELSLGPWAWRHVCSRVSHLDISGRVTHFHNYDMNCACRTSVYQSWMGFDLVGAVLHYLCVCLPWPIARLLWWIEL